MKIQILIDNADSWAIPNAKELCDKISKKHECSIIHRHEDVETGDILVLLSCEKLFKNYSRNKSTIVVHPSDLPQGKGWSPLAWQILEGKKDIPITLFEASDEIDSGDYYIKSFVKLDGTELTDESRDKLAVKINEMILQYIDNFPNIKPVKQTGQESFYIKRTEADSQLDIDKTINQQFNLLRIADNERYPAFFIKDGIKYILKIEKA